MTDPKGMTPEERLASIFGPITPDGSEPLWSQMDRCLLADMRTMLQGIRYYLDGNEIAPDGSPLGGGNLSMPIIATTALEVLARLYAGDETMGQSYNATANVERFIRDFSDHVFQRIPRLFWDAVRNGLHHNFYPNPHRYDYGGQSIDVQFQFSNAERISFVARPSGLPLQVILSAQDLFNALADAIQRYKARLEKEDQLQVNFICAWRALREQAPKTYSHAGREVKDLLAMLPEDKAIGIFTGDTHSLQRQGGLIGLVYPGWDKEAGSPRSNDRRR